MKLDSDVPAGLLINFSTDGFLILLDGFAFFFFFSLTRSSLLLQLHLGSLRGLLHMFWNRPLKAMIQT